MVRVIAIAAAATVCSAAVAAPLDVGGTVVVDATADTLGLEIQVTGTLRDETGRPVPYRGVSVRGAPISSDTVDAGFRIDVVTDDRGAFSTGRRVPPGRWRLDVGFAGDLYLDPASTRLDVAVEADSCRPVVDLPRVVAADAEVVEFGVVVTVAGRPASGVGVMTTSPCGAVSPLAVTDRAGRTEGELHLAAAATPSCLVEISVRGEGRFPDVGGQAVLRRVGTPRLNVEVEHRPSSPFDAGTWNAVATLWDEYGPVADAALTLDAGAFSELRRTDARGAAAFAIPVGAGRTTVPATVTFEGDLGVISATEEIVLEASRTVSAVFGRVAAAAAAMLVIALLGAVFLERRPRGRSTARRPASRRAVATERVEGPAPSRADGVWRVHVRDADTDRGIRASVVVGTDAFVTDENGLVSLPFDRPVEVLVSSSGYLPVGATVSPPRRTRQTVVRLRSVKAEVRDILRAVVADLDTVPEAESWWGSRTIEEVRSSVSRATWRLRREPKRDELRRREIERLVGEMASGSATEADAFDALSFLVDAVYFGGAGDADAAIGLARELAAASRKVGDARR